MAAADKVGGLSAADIRAGLARLGHGIPWAHHFDLNGVATISPEQDEKFHRKATGLKIVTDLALMSCRLFTRLRDFAAVRVLDVAPGEGAMSIAFAQAGVAEVVGIEGRQLYVERAQFVADALGVANATFVQGDVRNIDPTAVGEFDFVIVSGILHHLGEEDFWPFLRAVAKATTDTLFLYTHVSTPQSVQMFRLRGPVQIAGDVTGYLFREHADNATPQQREDRVRASLDNTFSFWATEESLLRALKRVGFTVAMKIMEPHPFPDYAERNIRIVLIARKSP